VSDSAYTRHRQPKRKYYSGNFIPGCLLLGVVLALLAGVALGPIGPGNQRVPEGAAMQQSRSIGLLLFYYANDNNGRYPDGNSSTEIFQKLLDEKYASDSTVFYIPRSGKTKPKPGQKLKPENVCFDVTSGLDSNSSDELPVVFTTGYRLGYAPGGSAIPLKTSPQFSDSRSMQAWLRGDSEPWAAPGIAAYYKSNRAIFIKIPATVNLEGSIPNFISHAFKPDGRTYRQLTPDGAMP